MDPIGLLYAGLFAIAVAIGIIYSIVIGTQTKSHHKIPFDVSTPPSPDFYRDIDFGDDDRFV